MTQCHSPGAASPVRVIDTSVPYSSSPTCDPIHTSPQSFTAEVAEGRRGNRDAEDLTKTLLAGQAHRMSAFPRSHSLLSACLCVHCGDSPGLGAYASSSAMLLAT